MEEIQLQISAGEDIRAVPGITHRVHRQGRLTAGNEVVVIPDIRCRLERRSRRVISTNGRTAEQHVDRVTHQLDVPVLLGCDIRDEVVERLHLVATTEIERLKRVVHERGHLAELTPEQFLNC